MKSVASTNDDSGVRLLKSGTCPSLSGKSKLGYQIGCTDPADIRLRVVANSNPGCFNQEWVTLRAIQAALDKAPQGEQITGAALDPLYRGRSLNTPFFLFAVLKHEKIVHSAGKGERGYVRGDLKTFMAEIQALAKGKAASQVDEKASKKKTTPQVGSKKTLKAKKKSAAHSAS
jgi:hypothetical protein